MTPESGPLDVGLDGPSRDVPDAPPPADAAPDQRAAADAADPCETIFCPPEERCDAERLRCVPDPCFERSCEEGLSCEPDTGDCRPPACVGVRCAAGEICQAETGDCVEDRCAEAQCEPGERCDPATGRCEGRAPRGGIAGPCEAPGECVEGACSTGEAWPGGFCALACGDSSDCGQGAACRSGTCLQRCDEQPCRRGWRCQVTPGAGSVCRPDCEVVGCEEGECNANNGACERCPHTCQADELCQDDIRCVRGDRSCETDYHCAPAVEQCHQGGCVPRAGVNCDNDFACASELQRCIEGACRFVCRLDVACPPHQACVEGVCDTLACMPGEACEIRAEAGTCVPLGDEETVCAQAGLAELDEACDRVPVQGPLACAAGLICHGDPDDSVDPLPEPNRGSCRALCDPAQGDCEDLGLPCIDLGDPDSGPVHPGLCLPSDCEVLVPGCAPDERCRIYSLGEARGLCGPAGPVPAEAPCRRTEDCAEDALCANTGRVAVCVRLCEPGLQCPPDRECVQIEGWAFGLCL